VNVNGKTAPCLDGAAGLGIGTDELVALVRETTHALPLNAQGGVTV